MSEISFNYTGTPPEHFKKSLFDAVRLTMADIKTEVLANKGFIQLDYHSDDDIDIRAVSSNAETTMKMTIKLQGLMAGHKLRGN